VNGQSLDNLKIADADKTDTFQFKYWSFGVKQHPLTLYTHATPAIKWHITTVTRV